MVLTLLSLFSITYITPTPEALKFYETNVQTITSIATEAQKRNSKLSQEDSLYLAYVVTRTSLKRDLDPLKVAAIISIESDFRLKAFNKSGDYSLAQINYKIWRSEFKRMGREPLKLKRLTQDPKYAINRMTEILSILRDRFPNKDFYGYYHSGTPKYRDVYLDKLNTRMEGIMVSDEG
jgi:soluble lytic murein transglycosylase-like protein